MFLFLTSFLLVGQTVLNTAEYRRSSIHRSLSLERSGVPACPVDLVVRVHWQLAVCRHVTSSNTYRDGSTSYFSFVAMNWYGTWLWMCCFSVETPRCIACCVSPSTTLFLLCRWTGFWSCGWSSGREKGVLLQWQSRCSEVAGRNDKLINCMCA